MILSTLVEWQENGSERGTGEENLVGLETANKNIQEKTDAICCSRRESV